MCRFRSGIIFKNRVELAPIYNESHSRMLEHMNIEDTDMNARTKFVRAELLPPDGNAAVDISKWEFHVDQDVVPDWFENDPGKYKDEFREAVGNWAEDNLKIMCGKPWIKFKADEKGVYYLLFDEVGRERFDHNNNNYATSSIREFVNNNELALKMKNEYGDQLVPITTDLLSLDGLDDYGVVEGDLFALLTLDDYRQNRKNIPSIGKWFWLATPDSTPSGGGAGCVRYVDSGGDVYCSDCGYGRAVRPFCIFKS